MALFLVTNIETRTVEETRYIRYHLTKPLPDNWSSLSTDEAGYWLNENAEFLDDEFDKSMDTEVQEKTIAVEVLD